MEGSSHKVTPEGVRDGDPEALRGLVARRGAAVVAFCEAVCDPEPARLAAAEAFARFRAAVAAWEDPAGLNPEVLLLGATRHAAASFARTAPAPGQRRARFGRHHEASPLCADVPSLLAARADGVLGPAELDALAAHLEAHPACANVEAAFRRAERGYRSPPAGGLTPATAEVLVAALAGAAPVAPEVAEEFDPGAAPFAEDDAWDDEPYEDEDVLEDDVDDAPEPEVVAEPEPEPVIVAEPEPEPVIVAEPEPEPEPVRLPDPPRHDEPVTQVLTAVQAPAPAPATGLPRRARMHLHVPHVDHGPVFRYVLPAAAVTVALIIILAVAGVFGGDGPAPGALLVV
jgi:hypothetical protein